MTVIYESSNTTFVHHVKNILENHGVACIVSGDIDAGLVSGCLGGGAKVLLMNEGQLKEAQDLLAKVLDESSDAGGSWQCRRCKEQLEAQFSECWKCGKERPKSR